jgi:hypothetical protein
MLFVLAITRNVPVAGYMSFVFLRFYIMGLLFACVLLHIIVVLCGEV